MKTLTSISTRMALMLFAGIALMQTTAHSSSVDERFKTALNSEIQKVKNTDNAVQKREMLGKFLTRMDYGMGVAKGFVSEKDGLTLSGLQLRLELDKAQLNGSDLAGNKIARVSDADLNQFANYVQQDVEQADQVVYISAGGLILILIILIILL